jgi:hypothetical protein
MYPISWQEIRFLFLKSENRFESFAVSSKLFSYLEEFLIVF